METKRYWIVEEGDYSDYSLYFIEDDPRLTKKEVEAVLACSEWYSQASIAGLIEGVFIESTNVKIQNIKEMVVEFAHNITYCYYNRKHTTNLDKKYTEDELCAIMSDNNPQVSKDSIKRSIKKEYPKYEMLYDIYQKLK